MHRLADLSCIRTVNLLKGCVRRHMSADDRVAIVTGGARGIGASTAERLASDGYILSLWDIDDTVFEQVDHLRQAGHEVAGQLVDVTDPDAVETATAACLDRYGRLDALVNNAGIPGEGVPLWEQSVERWRHVIDVDLTGVFLCCRAVVPHLRTNGWGRVVNVASIAGKEGNANGSAYSAAKGGVIALTKSLGKELASDGILVNCVTPTLIDTPLVADIDDATLAPVIDRIPMGRAGQPHEVAELIAWLCSPACSYSTGAVFDLSGGRATF